MAPISLADDSITSATPGVLVKGTVDPFTITQGLRVIVSSSVNLRILDPIDASYIVGGDEAYWVNFFLWNTGEMSIGTATTVAGSSGDAGPQFTEIAEDNIHIVLFYGSDSAMWDFEQLTASDDDEPFRFTAASVTAAGPTITGALRATINADSTVIAMLVDSSVAGIDIANLTYEEPVANTAPTVTMAAPTSPPLTAAPLRQSQARSQTTMAIALSLSR